MITDLVGVTVKVGMTAAAGVIAIVATPSVDLVGVAAIIGSVGSIIVIIFSQYNTRRAIRDAATKAEKDAKEHRDALAGVKDDMADMKKNVDGNLSAVKEIANKFSDEVVRLAQGGAPTPYGEPSAENPVTMSAGRPTVTPAPPPEKK